MSLARSSPSYGTQPYPTALLDIYRSIKLIGDGFPLPSHMCGPFCVSGEAVRRPQSLNRSLRPRSSARACNAIMCLVLGRIPFFHQRLTVYGYVPRRRAISTPRQAGLHLEPLQALREVIGEDVGYSAVVCALSRHGANPCHRRPQSTPLLDVQAGSRSGCAGFSCCLEGQALSSHLA